MPSKSHKRGRRRLAWLLAAPLVLFGAAAGAGWFYLSHLGFRPGNPLDPPFGGLQQAVVLVLGVDSDAGPARSDTLMLVRLDTSARRVGVLSVPRDLRVRLPGHGQQKINAAYSLGGAALAAEAVRGLTGVQPDYHVTIASEGLARLVDELGGVEIEVDKRMHYRDRRGGLYINLQPGRQRLDGNQAVGYVRYRHDPTGDLARIGRQQLFIRAALREALQPRNLARLPRLLRVFSQTVETDLTLRDLDAIADFVRGLDPDEIKARTLPSAPVDLAGISYLEADPAAVQRAVAETLYGLKPRVAVVNATGLPGVAADLVRRLADNGYQVGEVVFADYAAERSEIVDRTHHPDESAEIYRWLNCGEITHRSRRAIANSDITVVLGTDYLGTDPS